MNSISLSQLGPGLFLLFVALNTLCFFLIGLDKKKAIRHQWRIAERSFFMLALAGGALGTYLGMIFFRHKTKHLNFIWGMRVLIILHGIVAFYYLFF